jgi:hypothetical protein
MAKVQYGASDEMIVEAEVEEGEGVVVEVEVGMP